MTNAAEVLEAIVRHADAGGILYRTSPLISTASVTVDENDRASVALGELLAELRADGATPITSPLAPIIVKARTALGPIQPVTVAAMMAPSRSVGRAAILDLPHGLHPNIDEATYHGRVEGLASKSMLDKLARSPAHLRAYLDAAATEEAPAAFVIGTALHAALLEPDRFDRDYQMLPSFGDCRRKEPKANRDAWRKDHGWDEERECIPGVTLLTKDDYATVRGMVDSVRSHPLASKLLVGGVPELTLRWRDAETGIECKGRADYYVSRLGMAVDVKTTEDARASAFKKSVANYRYHAQQAFYSDGFAACGAPLKHFVFLVVEKTAPFAVALYSLDVDAVTRGRKAIQEDLATFAECLESGEWPAYPTSIQTLDLPGWSS